MPFAVLKACRWAERRIDPRVQRWDVQPDQIQGVLVHGHEELPCALYVLVDFGPIANLGSWLHSAGLTRAGARTLDTAVEVAFSYRLFSRLSLPDETLQTFDPAFRESMASRARALRLGDIDENRPDTWLWGSAQTGDYDALLMFFARTPEALDGLCTRMRELLAQLPGAHVVYELPSKLLPDRREHFGFRSGIAQPHLHTAPRVPPLGVFAPSDTQNQLAPGEFVLGYTNEFDEAPPSPRVPADLDREHHLPAARAETTGRDLGRNGSYLVLRQLSQDVTGFWRALAAAAGDFDACERLAAKLMGRWRSGAPLVASPEADRPELANFDAFGYAALDPLGQRCPIGAHVRRANPRDWKLAPDPQRAISMSNQHRLIRRSRPYGPALAESFELEDLIRAEDDGAERGLLFMCFNADIARQYEFVQEAWLNNPCFGGLRDETDPLLGSSPSFTVPGGPVARRYTGFTRWVRMRGGGYFFLPSYSALRFVATRSLELSDSESSS